MNKIHIILLMILMTCFACQKESSDDQQEPNVLASVPDMELDENVTRSAFFFNGSVMRFDWEVGDVIGVFNVSDDNTQSIPFSIYGQITHEGNTSSAHFINGNFTFDADKNWVAYYPHKCEVGEDGNRKVVSDYSDIHLTYRGQRQTANATPNSLSPNDPNSGYNNTTEAASSAHLVNYDYLISNSAKPNENLFTTFNFTHIGATVRFYMKFPKGSFGGEGKTGKVKSMTVVHEADNVLVSDVEIAIKKQSGTTPTTPSYAETSRTTTKELTLDFAGNDGGGIITIDRDPAYFIAYMMFYPVTVEAEKCHLLLTVEVDGVNKYFKSKPLSRKAMKAGKIYQWTTGEFNDPIELTATLLPWEDIQGGSISTGEE